jgi:hypothetical protein
MVPSPVESRQKKWYRFWFEFQFFSLLYMRLVYYWIRPCFGSIS